MLDCSRYGLSRRMAAAPECTFAVELLRQRRPKPCHSDGSFAFVVNYLLRLIFQRREMPTLILVGAEVAQTSVILNAPGVPIIDLGTRRVCCEELRLKIRLRSLVHSGTCVLVRKPNMWLCHAGWILPDTGLRGSKARSSLADCSTSMRRRRSVSRSSGAPATTARLEGRYPPARYPVFSYPPATV